MTAWSFAILNLKQYLTLFKKISMHCATTDFANFSSRDVTLIMWSFARNRKRSPEKFLIERAIGYCCRIGFSSFSNYCLCVLSWSFAMLGLADLVSFKLLFDDAKRRRIHHFSPKQMSMLTWSMATLRQADPDLLNAISDFFVKTDICNIDSHVVADVALSFAKLNVKNEAMFKSFVTECMRRELVAFDAFDTVNFIWSLTALEMLRFPWVLDFFNRYQAVNTIETNPKHAARVRSAFEFFI